MPTRTPFQLLQLQAFAQGLNSRDDPSEIELSQLADVQNMVVDDRSISQRLGYTEHRTDAGEDAVDGFYEHVESDGTRYLIKIVNGVLYYDDGTNWTSVNLPGGYTITVGERWRFFTYDGTTYGSNTVDNVIAISGATPSVTEKADVLKFKFAVPFLNRVYMVVEGLSIRFSELDDVETYPESNVVKVDPREAGDYEIRGLGVLHGLIGIFKVKSIHTWGGKGTSVIPVVRGVGCLNHDTIQFDNNNALIFADFDGLYATNLVSVVRISDPIEPTWLGRNYNFDSEIVSVFFKQKYRIAIANQGSGSIDRELVYDTRFGWMKNKGITPSQYVIGWDGTEEKLYTSNVSDAKVYEMETGNNDDGVAIESYFITALIDMQNPERRRKVKKAYVHLENSGNYDVKVGYRNDQDASFSEEAISLQAPADWLWGDEGHFWDGGDDWPSGGGSIDKYFSIAATKQRRIQFRGYMTGTNNFWRLFHIGIPFRQDNRFK